MSEKDFLQKYGNEEVVFSLLHKNRVIYENKELGIWCSGSVDCRDYLTRIEPIYSIFNLDNFLFGFTNKFDN